MGRKSYIHPKQYSNFQGLDMASSKLALGPQFATIAKNAIRLKGSTDVSCRWGFKATGRDYYSSTSGPGFGLFRYNNVNSATGAITEDLLSLDVRNEKVWVLRSKTMTIASASATTVLLSFYPTTAGIHTFYIHSTAGAVLFSFATDSSKGVPSQTVSQLITALNAAGLSLTAALGTAAGTEMVSNFLPIISQTALNSTIASVTLTGEQYIEVNRPTGHPWQFSGWYAKAATSEAELPSSTNLQNCLYISTGYDDLLKYDGVALYKAGLPIPAAGPAYVSQSNTFSARSTDPMNAGWFAWVSAYEHIDAQGNVFEGIPAVTRPTSTLQGAPSGPQQIELTGVNTSMVLTLRNLIPSQGYRTNYAVNVGAKDFGGGSLVINADDGAGGAHFLQVGDIACFRVYVVGGTSRDTLLVTSEILARTNSTITISEDWNVTHCGEDNNCRTILSEGRVARFSEEDCTLTQIISAYTNWYGGAPTIILADNWPISNNVRINLYRSKGEGLATANRSSFPTFYLNDILPNDASTTTQSFTDEVSDLLLGPELDQKITLSNTVLPAERFSAPPRGKYITSFQNRLYLTGDPLAPNALYRSDVLYGPEYFEPTGSADLDLSTKRGDYIVGIHGAGDSLVVGKSASALEISGDLSSATNIVIKEISENVGVVSHASMTSLKGEFMWSTPFGPAIYSQGTGVRFLGATDDGQRSRIEGAFTSSRVDLKMSTAIIHPDEGLYIIFVPYKWMTSPTDNFTALSGFRRYLHNVESISDYTFGTIYAFDLKQGAWLNWTNMDATGGFAIRNKCLYWSRATYSAAVSDYTGWTFKQNNTGSIRDYVDWNDPIAWEWATYWEMLGDKETYKNFLRIKVEATGDQALAGNAMSITATTEQDFQEGTTQSSAVLSMTEGTAPLEDDFKLVTNKAKSMRLRLASSTMYTRPGFSGLQSEIAAPFRPKLTTP